MFCEALIYIYQALQFFLHLFFSAIVLKDDSSNVRSRAAESLGKLNQNTQTILPDIVQWIEAQPDNIPIGGAIDVLWAIVVE